MPVAVALTAVLLVMTTVGATVDHRPSRAEALWAYARKTTPLGAQRVLLIGDSDVGELALTMAGAYDAPGVRGLSYGSPTCRLEDLQLRAGSLGVAVGPCRAWWQQVRGAVHAFRPDTVAVLFGSSELTGTAADAPSAARTHRIRLALDRIRDSVAPRGSNLALLTPPCARPGAGPASSGPADRAWLTGLLRAQPTRATSRVDVLDYGGAICPGGAYLGTLDGASVRSSAGVLTPDGARITWSWIAAHLCPGCRVNVTDGTPPDGSAEPSS
jgi:hypothetical protein